MIKPKTHSAVLAAKAGGNKDSKSIKVSNNMSTAVKMEVRQKDAVGNSVTT